MADSPPHVVLCWPGKTTAEYASVGIQDYLSRIRKFRRCECVVVSEEPSTKHYSDEHRAERQGKAILKRLEAFQPLFLVALDPRGKSMDSRKFADLLQRQCYDDARTLAFVVGGPDGLSPTVRGRVDLLLGLSSMTLPHDMARLFLTEQIYRGFTLIHGLPYSR
jgi:23S rRNA (pseudouridine1915-N3)-methyltransferase